MLDREAITTRITEIRRRRSFLEDYVGEPFGEFAGDVSHYEAALRHIQIAVQACLDIARHIISVKRFGLPKEMRDSFSVLAERGILSEDLSKKLTRAASVRNILVHSYIEIDPRIIYKIINEDLIDLERFVDEIGGYLKKEGGEKNV